MSDGTAFSTQTDNSSAIVLYAGPIGPQAQDAASHMGTGSSFVEVGERQEYVGLSNQGATCYMNSLLQTLFMTPELRQNVYRWEYDPEKHGDKKDCIPYQLQTLFGMLQITDRAYVPTKALTKSFGWDVRESFQQHDVQEFCRVLFDAIELSVNGTFQENMINELYEGTLIDYVKCLKCGNESRREDKFLDLSLTIKNEFENIQNDSVEKAMENYTKTDKLEGDNQYFCARCNEKVDALKGMKFFQFPYILALQLKRFDIDFTTMQRRKLHDEVRFPNILNLNPYIQEEELVLTPQTSVQEAAEVAIAEESIVVTPSDLDHRDLKEVRSTGVEAMRQDADKQPVKIDHIARSKYLERCAERRKAERDELVTKYLKEGEHVYELFSINIHSGGAMGGHYYAYIKNFETNRWYNFNDSSVREIDQKDIEKVYGGTSSTGTWTSAYSASAYMLMYRKVRSDNLIEVTNEEVPTSVFAAFEDAKNEAAKEKAEHDEKML